ncbi:MAG: Glu/Leu/Phe/Val dehydrogenase dimerization domain-containing protein [Lentilitoribacter sp.]
MLPIIHELPAPDGFERLIYAEHKSSGLKSYIAIHSTVCGPAAGGCRMWNYDSDEAAKEDVLRLAKGMTSKNAIAGLGLGGGKSVIIGDAKTDKSADLLRAFGKVVDYLKGSYFTAEDVGISPQDMAIVAQETPYAAGLNGGNFASGDPSPFTAEGVFQCLKVGADKVFKTKGLARKRVLVQGLGHVGMSLAEKLHESGAELIVSDINTSLIDQAISKFDAKVCSTEHVFDTDMDIFAPCALGGILSHDTVANLSAKLICGAANNQLASPLIADEIQKRGITYLPDYVVNAGGIINAAGEILKQGHQYRDERIKQITERIHDIIILSEKTGKTTIQIADEMVNEILMHAVQNEGAA